MHAAKRLAALLLAALLAACAEQPGLCTVGASYELPITVRDNAIYVAARVGDKPARFILDTGAITTSITDAAADRLGIPYVAGGAADVGGVGGVAVSKVATLGRVTLGGLTVPEQRVTVTPAGSIVGRRDDDGIMGLKGLDTYDWDIDLPHHRLALYPAGTCTGNASLLPGPTEEIFAPWTHQVNWVRLDHRLYAYATLDGRKLTALIDTGATQNGMWRQAMFKLGLTAADLAKDRTGTARGFGTSVVTTQLHRFDRLEVAGIVTDKPQFTVIESATEYEWELLLGMDWLIHHRIWLSFPRYKVFVIRGGT